MVRIQCLARVTSAKARVRLIRQRAYLTHTRKSAVMIQKHVRRLFARRLVRKRRYKLQWIAARLIQGWYRTKKAKVKSLKIKQILIQRKLWLGAEGMQCLVRRKIARSRVNRIRLRRLYLYLFSNATTIQTLIRKFLGICQVRDARNAKAKRLEIAKKMEMDQALKDNALDELREARELLDGANIFSQTRVGNAVNVDDIFNGKLSEKHEADELDENDDTVLTIAASRGYIDIVRKCFQWAFNFNHKNASGLTALMLAVQNNHFDVVQYILAPPVKFKLDRFSESDSAFLLVSSLETQVQMRQKNNKYAYKLDMFKALMNQSLPATAKDPISGTTAVHTACGLGDIETFRILLKAKAKHDLIDDVGCLPLHRACTSNMDIVRMLLGLDSSSGILMADSKRAPIILIKDADAKDCRLYAALYGQGKILQFLQDTVKNNREAFSASQRAVKEDIGWTPEDFNAILRLAEEGNVECFDYIVKCGFDPLWAQPETGMTVLMRACEHGQLGFIDFLFTLKLNFQESVDKEGNTLMHYAAKCVTETVVAHILSCPTVSDRGVTEMSICSQNNEGKTCLHIAAECGVITKVDLLAPNGVEAALNMKDKNGLTPLAAAASAYQLQIVSEYMGLDASATAIDNNGHSIMWHLFHPANAQKGVEPMASELASNLGLHAKLSRGAREAKTLQLAADVKIIRDLVSGGCSLYAAPTVTPEELLSTSFKNSRNPESASNALDIAQYCPGDLLVQELSLSALEAVVEVSTITDCWRLLLSSIRYDCGTGKAFIALFEAGIADRLRDVLPLVKAFSKETVSHLAYPVMFGGLTVAGWCIHLGNGYLLNKLYRKGFNPQLGADVRGDSCLHVIARFGTSSMVDMTLNDDRVIIEALNASGNTALMEASKMGNFPNSKRLIACQASARRALNGKYWGWLLALARKQESTESNLQTGRIGDDDMTYFPSADPWWYEQAMDQSLSKRN